MHNFISTIVDWLRPFFGAPIIGTEPTTVPPPGVKPTSPAPDTPPVEPPILPPTPPAANYEAIIDRIGMAFSTTLKKEQREAIALLLTECEAQGITDERKVAYILGTVYHECGFRSIKELRAKAGTPVWKMQEKYWHAGYYGRGFSQLTWRYNYKKFSPIVGFDLVKNPDKVLEPAIGAKIIVTGMRRGLFTGKDLDNYFNPTTTNWYDARRIVNGTFMADKVADAALKILPTLKGEEA